MKLILREALIKYIT